MDDLIKREDAIEFAKYSHIEALTKEERIAWIMDIPSAEKQGEWIMNDIQRAEDTDNGNYQYTCSVCGHGDIHAMTQEVPYCWWCGVMDLIKREKVFEHIKAVCLEGDGGALITSEDFLKMAIKGIPSAEPKVDKNYLVSLIQEAVYDGEACKRLIETVEPKQGEWLFKKITDDYHVIGQCSVCKERRRIDNYCPNCGAIMKGVDDDSSKV